MAPPRRHDPTRYRLRGLAPGSLTSCGLAPAARRVAPPAGPAGGRARRCPPRHPI